MASSVTFDLFARDRASSAFAKVGAAAQAAGKDVDGLGKKAGGLSGRFTAISRLGPRSFGLIATGAKAAGLALGGAAVTGAAFGLKTAASMETAKIGFTTMLGSAQKAGAFLKDLQQFAAATPFEFPELQTAASSLISVGINAKDVIPIMKTLGNVTAGMGTGSEGIKRATVALQQMTAAQRITAEDLNQLRDAGIPVYDLLASATGKTKAEVVKLAQAGKLGKKELDQMMDALKSGKGLERFNGLMEKQSKSLSGIFSTLKDNVSMTLANLVTPVIPAVKAGLDVLSNLVGKVAPKIQGGLEALMGFISRNVVPGFEAMGAAFSGEGITSDGFVGVMERIGVAARGVVDTITGVVKGVKQKWQELREGFTLGIRTTPFQSLGTNAFEVFQSIKRRWDEIKAGFTLGIRTTGLERFGSDLWEAVQKAKRFVEDKKPTINLGSIARNFGDQAQTWATNIIDGIETGLTKGDWSQLGQTVGTGILSAIGGAADLAKKLTVKIGELFGKVDWVGLGITVGKAAVPFFVGLAAGLLNFDMVGLLKGVMAHWSDILLAAIAIFLTPARVIGKVAELLARIPLVGEFLAWGLRAIKGFVDGMGKAIIKGLGSLGKSFLEGFARVFPGIENGFLTHLRNLPTYIGVVTLEVIAKAKLMLRALGKAIGDGIGGVVAEIGELIGRMLKPFANAGGWLLRRGAEFVGGLARGISGAIGSAAAAAGRVISSLTVRFVGASKWLVSAGGELIRGLLNGARSALSGVGQWIKDIGGRIVSAVKGFFGIHSPSTVFAELGGHMITGLIKGMADKNPTALVTKVFGGMTGALKALFGKGLLGTAANLSAKALDALGLSVTVSGSGSFGGNNEDIVRSLAATLYGWTGAQWTALRALLMGESGFNSNAQNPTSTAYGLFQFLDSTWASVGAQKTSDPGRQTVAGLRYIAGKYGTPVNAFSAWLNRSPHWYGTGLEPTMFNRPTLIGVGERGPEMVSVTPQRMLQPARGGGQSDVADEVRALRRDLARLPIAQVDERYVRRSQRYLNGRDPNGW